MKIGVPKETASGEKRVALVPEAIKRLAGKGHEVVVEAGAGGAAGIPDAAFADAGATIESAAAKVWGADVVAKVIAPDEKERKHLGADSVLVGFLSPLTAGDSVAAIAKSGATAFAMEAIPRISRAQAMDALSSQANVGGYVAVLIGARELPRYFPMFMTAAGTIPPAQVLVLGAGVAGLQAIATSRRLGAVVTAFDVRAAVKEQVQSLGAKFLEVEEAKADGEGTGGYAKELDAETQRRQAAALATAVARADVVITTAQVPGRPAPKLITADAVHAMKPGSVIVDLAGESGGNCELTVPGTRVVTDNGVTVTAPFNLPSELAEHASAQYARNVQELLQLMSGEDGALALDFEDEIIAGACITRGGEIVHEGAKAAAGAAAPAKPARAPARSRRPRRSRRPPRRSPLPRRSPRQPPRSPLQRRSPRPPPRSLQPRSPRTRTDRMHQSLVIELAILVLAGFVGFEVISKVPNTLHTPLMSGTNAIHGIVLLGGIVAIGVAHGFLNDLLLVIAIVFGTINVVGGFLVTDRMLEMFKRKPVPKKTEDAS